MSFLFSSFDKAKTKSQLKLSMQRIGLLRNKKMQKVEADKKSISMLLRAGKDENARIKAEHLIKDVSTMEGLEMLQQLCDLLLARFALVETEKVCDPDIKEIVCTIIWAAPRCEVQELLEVKKQLIARYGKKLGEEATEDVKDNEWLNPRVVFKLMYRRPTDVEISQCLSSVAKEHGVEWQDDVAGQMDGYNEIPTVPEMPPPDQPPGGGGGGGSGGGDVPEEVRNNMPKQQYATDGAPLPPVNPAARPPNPPPVAGWQPQAPAAPPAAWTPPPPAPPANQAWSAPGPAAGATDNLGPPPPFDPTPIDDAPPPPPAAPPAGWTSAAPQAPPPPAPAGGWQGGDGGLGGLPSFPSAGGSEGGGKDGPDDPPDNDELERRFAALKGK